MADTLESLEIEIVHSSGGAATEIGKLTSSISKLSASLTRVIPKLKEFADALGKISNPVTINDIHDSTFNKTINNVKQVASAYKGIKQAAKVPVADDLRNAISQFSEVEVLMGKLTGLQDAMEQAFNAGDVQKAIALRGQIIQTQKAIDKLTESTKKATGGLSNFFASLKRITMYRILRTIIKEITQAIKEGIDNLYEFSKANNDLGGVSSALDSLASAAQTTKNQLGATFGQMLVAIAPSLEALLQLVAKLAEAFYPLVRAIAALEPVITAVVNVVTELINVLIALFELLGLNVGKIVAQDATKQWKEAKTAAGDYKRTILGFDEINRLNAPSGGGGGYNGGGFADALKELGDGNAPKFKTFEWLSKFIKDIEDATEKVQKLSEGIIALPKGAAIAVAFTVVAGKRLKEWLENPNVGNSWVWNIQLEPQLNATAATEAWRKFVEGLTPRTIEVEPAVSPDVAIEQYNQLLDTLRNTKPNIEIEPQVDASEAIEQFMKLKDAVDSASTFIKVAVGMMEGAVSNAMSKMSQSVSTAMETIRNVITGKSKESKEEANQNFSDMFTHSSGKFTDLATVVKESFFGIHSVIKLKSKDSEDDSNNHFGGMSENAKNNIINLHDVVGDNMDDTKAAISLNLKDAYDASVTHFGGILQSASTAMSGVASSVHDSLDNANQNFSVGLSTSATNVNTWSNSTLGKLASWAKGVVQNIKSGIDAFKSDNPVLGTLIFGVESSATTSYPMAPLLPAWSGGGVLIPAFASGGFPDSGDLFIASESGAGAEMVGSIGNRTAVANNDQIVEAVSEGVFNAVSSALGGRNDSMSIHVYLDSREIKAGQNRLARAAGV